jgi:hypothetical protein
MPAYATVLPARFCGCGREAERAVFTMRGRLDGLYCADHAAQRVETLNRCEELMQRAQTRAGWVQMPCLPLVL